MLHRDTPDGPGHLWIWTTLIVLSGALNILALSGAIYMLQVYDRVLTSHSVETLVVLSVLVAGLYVAFGLLDALRSQMLLRLGARFDQHMMPLAHRSTLGRVMLQQGQGDPLQPVKDVDVVRTFLSGPAPGVVLDLPWMPVFLGFVWLISPPLGLLSVAGLLVLCAIAWLTHAVTKGLDEKAAAAAALRSRELESSVRGIEPALAMGFRNDLLARYMDANSRFCEAHSRSGDHATYFAAASKVVRLLLQSGILGLGAYLALQDLISTGGMIAASIAATRALAPAEQAIGSWRGITSARDSYRRLQNLVSGSQKAPAPSALPRPSRSLSIERAMVLHPGGRRLILSGISFDLRAGSGLVVTGKSGSGKSSLARVLAGVAPLAQGSLRFDGTPLERWATSEGGSFIGYMPQTVELYEGTIAENIARLDSEAPAEWVEAAAQAAGVHDLILQLPEGYETRLIPGGQQLSAGQRQLIGLARALYDDPFLIVLDEPATNLDAESEKTMLASLQKARRRGAIVVVVTHRSSVLGVCDLVARLDGGQIKAFGLKSEVLENTVRPVQSNRTVELRKSPDTSSNRKTAS